MVKLHPGRIIPWCVIALLLILAFFFKYMVPGYSFSALVCVGLSGLVLFYAVMPLLSKGHPGLARGLTLTVSAILALGILAAGITEVVILKESRGDPEAQAKYVVVLGAKVREDGPSVSLWDRIYGAYDYLASHPDTIAVVSGGQGPDEHMTEAQSMFDELTKLGIDPGRILLEEKATSTRENILFSLDLIEEETGVRPQKIAVVSSEYHLCRAGMLTRKCGAEFVGVPAKTSHLSQKVNHFLREIAGVWQLLLLGE